MQLLSKIGPVLFLATLTVALAQDRPKRAKDAEIQRSNGPSLDSAVANRPNDSQIRPLYHGVHPGSATGDETSIEDLDAYMRAVGVESVAYVYFSQELDQAWLDGESELFPRAQIEKIRKTGAVPFIRLMTRTTTETNSGTNREKTYSYDVLLNDANLPTQQKDNARKFHNRILAWGQEAAKETLPIFVEWGTEVNGDWFWWNARWYGESRCSQESGRAKERCLENAYPDGLSKFRRVFRRLRDLINKEAQANNVKWLFHIASSSSPEPSQSPRNRWNSLANYFPEQDTREKYVDAIGVSIYGAQRKADSCSATEYSFVAQLNQLLEADSDRDESDTLRKIGLGKDVFILEFGETLIVNKGEQLDSNCNAGKWATDALNALVDLNRWQGFNLVGFSWWNEAWIDKKDGITDMRVQAFDLCGALESPEDKRLVEKSIGCDCWTTRTKNCRNLNFNRTHLKESLIAFLKKHEKVLRTISRQPVN